MRLGHRLASQGQFDGRAEQLAGNRFAVTGCGLVERSAVGQPTRAVVEEEVRRAGGVVSAAGLPGKLVRPVVGVSIGVVGADATTARSG